MSKRILVVSQRFWPENTRINDICSGLTERGCRVDVLAGQPNYPSGKYFKGYHMFGHRYERFGKVSVYRAGEINRDDGTGPRVLLNYYSFSFFSRFKRGALKKAPYDGVLVFQRSPVMSAKMGLWIGKKLNIPVTIMAVDVWPYSFYQEMDLQNGLLRKLYRKTSEKIYLASDKIITVNENAKRFFTGELHIHPNKVDYLPFYADKSVTEKVKDINVMERFAGSFNVVYTGRIDEEHDLDPVIDAAEKLDMSGIRDLKFILVGTGPELKRLKKLTSKKRLTDIVFFEEEESPDGRAKYFNIADAFLSCGRPERRGEYAPVEDVIDYMSAGKPVLITGGGAERHIIKEAKCGISVDGGNKDGLFEAVMKLYRSPKEKLEAYGEAAIQYSEKHFDREQFLDSLLETMFEEKGMQDDGFIINQSSGIITMEED